MNFGLYLRPSKLIIIAAKGLFTITNCAYFRSINNNNFTAKRKSFLFI
jgi:hypothetical protein